MADRVSPVTWTPKTEESKRQKGKSTFVNRTKGLELSRILAAGIEYSVGPKRSGLIYA